MQLNPSQQKAVEHNDGPLLLVAGAGTGKTRVITEKIRYFIQNNLANPEEILALTFTEKAAGEMVNRVDEVMPLGYQEPWISTFHSFGDRILKKEGLEIGLDPSYKIITSSDQWMLLRKYLFDLPLNYYRPLGNPAKFISNLVNLFSRAQDENISAQEWLAYCKKEIGRSEQTAEQILESKKQLELAQTFARYNEIKIEESLLDFGDLITLTISLFKERPNILAKYQQQFKLIMVDEFQDTNYAQYQLIKLLAPAEKNPLLMVVGDDDQSIYKWRGASITNVLYFKQNYPQTKILSLTDNYRSDQTILQASHQFIQNNPSRLETRLNISKKLIAHYQPPSPAQVELLSASTGEQEAELVANALEKYNQQDYLWQDMVILARANNHLEPFVTELKNRQIPYQLAGNRGLFDQEEIKQLVSFLKASADEQDTLSLIQVLRFPIFRIDKPYLLELINQCRRTNLNLWQVLTKQEDNSIKKVVRILSKIREKIIDLPTSQILEHFIKGEGYLNYYLQEESLENQLKIKNISRFFEIVKRFETQVGQNSDAAANTLEFLSYFELLKEAGENPAQAEIEDVDTVSLMTAHGSKGLEFKIVVIPCLIKDRFPTRDKSEKLELPAELIAHRESEQQTLVEEERRLFYVACTRAREKLLLTYAKNYGGKRETKPSPFLEEMFANKITPSINQPPVTSYHLPVSNDQLPATSNKLISVSYSQIEIFKTCPRQYKYNYILKIPTLPSSALNFGQTLHRTLKDFHQRPFFGQDPSFEELLNIYQKQWLPGGYQDSKHQDLAKEKGRQLLLDYYQNHQERLFTPIHLEKRFTLHFGPVKLNGFIDRIGTNREGKTELVDYKTGKEGAAKEELDKEAKNSEQLSIYTLAALEDFKIKADQVCLYFLEHGYKAVSTRSDKQLEKTRDSVSQVIKEMGASQWPPSPGFHCQWCAYSQICPEAKLDG